jgi:hypothetical protein
MARGKKAKSNDISTERYQAMMLPVDLTEAEVLEAERKAGAYSFTRDTVKKALRNKMTQINGLKVTLEELAEGAVYGRAQKVQPGHIEMQEYDADERAALERRGGQLTKEIAALTQERGLLAVEVKDLTKQIEHFTKLATNRATEREVTCEWQPDFETRTEVLYRLDTGEALEKTRRALREHVPQAATSEPPTRRKQEPEAQPAPSGESVAETQHHDTDTPVKVDQPVAPPPPPANVGTADQRALHDTLLLEIEQAANEGELMKVAAPQRANGLPPDLRTPITRAFLQRKMSFQHAGGGHG